MIDLRVKVKESENIDKYLDLEREIKKWNMRMTVMPVIFGTLVIVSKGLEQRRIGNQMKN